MADYVQAKQAFTCALDVNGYLPFAVGAGDIFSTSDEVVRRYPNNFRELDVRDSGSVRRPLPRHPGAVETATAAPGELRQITRPPERARKTRPAPAAAPSDAPSEV